MLFSPKPRISNLDDLNIRINNEKIFHVHECKFLGLIVDEQFSWKKHATYTANKVAKSVGILSKARKY